jgi:ATP-binding cassette, subfamily B, bacterial
LSPPRLRSTKAEPRPPLKKALRDSVRYIKRTLALVWKSSPPLTLALTVLVIAGALVPPAIAWAGKRIVDNVIAGSRDATLTWVGIELALVATQAGLNRGSSYVRSTLGSRLGIDVNVMILERATRLGLRHFEDPEFYDRLTRARREASSRPLSLVIDVFSLAQQILTLAGYAALLVSFSGWVVLVLMIATVPATIAELRYSKATFRLRNWRSPDSRRLLYMEHVLANDAHAKEMKLFALGPLFLGRYKELAEKFHAEDVALARKRTVLVYVLSLLATLAFYGAYAFMAVGAAINRLTLGNLTLYVMAFRNGQSSFHAILTGITSIYEHNLYMSNLYSYLDEEIVTTETEEKKPKTKTNGALPREEGIRLENVSFRYPGQEKDNKWVLRNVDLFVPRGKSIALVGQNGAGKTTLVKLVTGLYEPTEGRVLLDGKDVKDWDKNELVARFGVVFQDFNRYQLKVRENVGFGSVDHLEDEPRIERAVDRGGAEPVIEGLASGIDTQLGRWFENGTELSGGQWQKIALARGFMREQADILVLDEPTAALDAEAEHAVFTRFKELAEGRTTIIISHRFPTVRMADRILVLENGHVIEDGTHAELLAANKTYARLYNMQAEGYV